jgi:hypothetical protein
MVNTRRATAPAPFAEAPPHLFRNPSAASASCSFRMGTHRYLAADYVLGLNRAMEPQTHSNPGTRQKYPQRGLEPKTRFQFCLNSRAFGS